MLLYTTTVCEKCQRDVLIEAAAAAEYVPYRIERERENILLLKVGRFVKA